MQPCEVASAMLCYLAAPISSMFSVLGVIIATRQAFACLCAVVGDNEGEAVEVVEVCEWRVWDRSKHCLPILASTSF